MRAPRSCCSSRRRSCSASTARTSPNASSTRSSSSSTSPTGPSRARPRSRRRSRACSRARSRRSARRSRRSSSSAPTARRCGAPTVPGSERVTMVEADRGAAEELAALIDAENPVVSLTPPYEPAGLREHLEQRGIRNAMVAMLPGESRLIGIIMLANRFGLERSYGGEDRRLLEVLANNASVALQYDRLEQAVTKLRTLQEELHHQAYHDPLTGLPNRLMFMERLRGELADGTGTLGGAVHRRRRLQDRQRHARPRRRRRAADLRRGPAAAFRAPAGHRRPARRRRVRGHAAGRRGSRRGARRRGHAGAARLRDAGARRRRAGARPPQRRHRRQPPDARPRRADPRGRPRDVPGQDVGQGPLRVLRPADGGRDAAPPRPQEGAGRGDRASRARGRVPADRRPRDGAHQRRRGARALGAPRARPDRARGVHPAGGGVRPDPGARPARAGADVPPGAALGGRRAG